MAKFSKTNFRLIIEEIEEMESTFQNIWVPIGILEIMYDDYAGIIDKYFHSEKSERDIDKLWEDLKYTYSYSYNHSKVPFYYSLNSNFPQYSNYTYPKVNYQTFNTTENNN